MSIQPGYYRGRAIQAALTETKSGKEQVAVEFEFLDESVEGQRLTWYGFFSDAAIDITLKALRTCGWQGTDLSSLSGVDANEVQLVVEHEAYEGRIIPRIRWVNALGAISFAPPMEEKKLKSFAQKMKGRIAAFDKGGAAPKLKSTRAPEPPPNLEEPPF